MAKIVVATDWEVLRKEIAGALQGAGHEVDPLPGDADQILARLEDPLPDLFLLDLVALSNNKFAYAGLRVVGSLKFRRPDARVVIFTTVDRLRNEVRRALEAGAQGYVRVPFARETLLKEVERALKAEPSKVGAPPSPSQASGAQPQEDEPVTDSRNEGVQ